MSDQEDEVFKGFTPDKTTLPQNMKDGNYPKSQILFDDDVNDDVDDDVNDEESSPGENLDAKEPDAKELEETTSENAVSDITIMDLANTIDKSDANSETADDSASTSKESGEGNRKSARIQHDTNKATIDEEKTKNPRTNSVHEKRKNKTEKALESLERDLNDATDQIKQLETTMKSRSQIINNKNAKITEGKNKLIAIQGELAKAREKIIKLEDEIEELELKSVEDGKKIQENNETIENLQKLEATTRQKLKAEKTKATNAKDENTILENDLKEKNETIENLQKLEATTRQKLKAEKTKVTNAKEENTSLENEIKQLQKQTVEDSKEIQEKDEIIENLQKVETTARDRLKAGKQKINKMTEQENTIIQKLSETETEMAQTLKENTDMSDRLEKKDRKIEKTQKQLEKKNKEFEDLMRKYIGSQEANKLQKGTEGPQTEQTGMPKNQKTALLIADSNGKRIKPKLTRNDGVQWMHVRNVYRAKDIPRQLENEDVKQQLNAADSITIMVGLNEIRDGKSALDTLKSIEENTLPLITTNKPIIICEIPPLADDISNKTEAKCLNVLLKRIPERHPNVTLLKSWDELDEYEPSEIFEDDLFHLHKDKDGTTIMAQKIMDLTKQAHHDAPAKEIVTEKITIPKESARHFIGTGGNTLKKLTSDHQVNIAIPRDADELVVTGIQENVRSATQEILIMKESINRRQQQQHNYRSKLCTYYQKGHCRKGENCTFSHETPSRSRSRSNVRDEHMTSETEQHENETRTHQSNQQYSDRDITHHRHTEEEESRSRSGRSQQYSQEERHQTNHYRNNRRSRSLDRQRRTPEEHTRRSRSNDRNRSNQNARRESTWNTSEQKRSSRNERFYSQQ